MAADKEKRNNYPPYFQILCVVLALMAGGICVVGGRERQFSFVETGKILIESMVVTVFFVTVLEYVCKKNIIRLKEKDTIRKQQCYRRYAFWIGFVVILSFGMVLCNVYVNFYHFWMLGGLLLSVSFNPYIGIPLQFLTLFLSCIFQGKGLEYFTTYFILGAGLCLLASFLRQISMLGYVMIIGLMGNAMALVLENNFSLDKVISLESLYSEISMFGVILLAAWMSWVYRGYFIHGNFQFIRSGIQNFLSEDENEQEEDIMVPIGEFEGFSEEKESGRSTLEKLGSTGYPLLKQLKETKNKVYLHSKQVAVLAEGAAEQIGIDRQLVYIGGLYHEIGKLYSKDYVTEGISIGRQYGFPKKLIALIAEHNVTYKIPTTKEAAVLMLADSVIFFLEHIEEKGLQKNKSVEDMIESIFQIRYEKGELDQSGLTIRDFKVLRAYCVDYSLMVSRKENDP